MRRTFSSSGPRPVVKAPSFGWPYLPTSVTVAPGTCSSLSVMGLKDAPVVVGNVWPLATVQTCIIHIIRGSFRLSSRKYWDELKRDIRPIYTAANANAARAAFDDMADKWGARYPAIVKLWDNAWVELADSSRQRNDFSVELCSIGLSCDLYPSSRSPLHKRSDITSSCRSPG